MNLFALSVELGMDTSSFEQGVDRARAKTSALAGELNPRFSGIGKTLTGAFTKSQLLATSIIGLAKKFSSLGEGIVNQGVAFNQQMEKYTTGFTNMLGSAEKAQAVLNQIKQDAARTPLNVDSLVQANQLLISAGVSAGEARSTILALGDAVSATGGGSEVLSRMAANLQQIKNVGKAASIDIKQFAMAGIDIYGVLADYTGKSTAEVQGMTITYDLLTAALKKASEEGGRYYNAMETQSQTLSGRIETLKDNWSQLLGTLTKGLTETEGNLVTAAAGWVQRLQEGFETAGANGLMQAGGHIVDEVASGISAGIPSLAARAEDAVQNFALYLQDNTGQIVDTGGKLLVSLASGILDMAPAIVNSAEQIFSAFVVELWNHADEIFTTGADLVGKLVKGFLSLTGNVIEAAGNITAAIVTKIFTTDWVQVGKDVVSSIGQGILNGVSAMSGPLDRLSYKLNHALGKNGYEENTFEAWAAANGKTGETRYQQGSQKDAAYWKRYGDKLAQQYGLNETGTDTGSGETDATPGGSSGKSAGTKSNTETVISSVTHTATTTAQNALGAVTTSVETLQEKVKDAAGNIKDRVTETTTETGKEMFNGVATTYTLVTKKVTDANGKISTTTKKVYADMSKTLLGTLTTIAEKTFNGITTTTQQAVETYADGSQHIKQTITKTYTDIIDGALRTVKEVQTIAEDGTTLVAKTVEKASSGTFSGLLQGWKKEADKGVLGTFSALATAVKSKDWKSIGQWVISTLYNGLAPESQKLIDDFGRNLIQRLNKVLGDKISDISQKAWDIGSSIADGIAKGLGNALGKDGGVQDILNGLNINVSDVGSKIMGMLGTMGTSMGNFAVNAGTKIAGFAGSMGSLGTIAEGAGGLIAKVGSLIISNPEVAAIIAIVVGVVALGAALFAKFGKSKSNGGQAVSHYESPFAGNDVYDSLTEFSTRAAMQHRYMEKTTGTDAQLGILQQIRDLLDEHLPDIGTGQLVMDGEKVADMLTPRLATNMDTSMGVYTLRAERGV